MSKWSSPYKTIDGLPLESGRSSTKEPANTFYAGPTGGVNKMPTFRKIVSSDLPTGTPSFGGFTNNGAMFANGTGTIASTDPGEADTFLSGNGPNAAPSFKKVNLEHGTTSVLKIDKGGTGVNSTYTLPGTIFAGPIYTGVLSSPPGPPVFRDLHIGDFSAALSSEIGFKMSSLSCDFIVKNISSWLSANHVAFTMNDIGANKIASLMTAAGGTSITSQINMDNLTSRFTQLNMNTLTHTGGASAAGISVSYFNTLIMTDLTSRFTQAHVMSLVATGGALAATEIGELMTPKYSAISLAVVEELPLAISNAATAATGAAVAASTVELLAALNTPIIGVNPRMNNRTGFTDTYVMQNAPTLTGTTIAEAITLTTPLATSSGGTGISSTNQSYAFLGPLAGTGPPTWRAITSADIPSTGTPVFSSLTPGGAMYAASDSNIVAATNVFMTGTQIGIGAQPATGYALDITSTVGSGNIPMMRIAGGGGPQNKAGISLTHGALTRPGGDATKILAHDDGAYSSHLVFHTAPPGNPGNGVAIERVRFTSGGAFCFGTTTATKTFNIAGTSNTDVVFIKNTSATGFSSIQLQNNSTQNLFIGVSGTSTTGPQGNMPFITTTSNTLQLPATITTVLGSLALPTVTATGLSLTNALPVASGGTGVSTIAQSYAFLGPISGTGPPTWRAIEPSDIPSTGTPSFANLNPNGIAYAISSSTLATTLAGTQYQSLIANATGSPTFQALNLGQAAAVTGTLAVIRGGTGTTTSTGTGSVVLSDSPTFTGAITVTTATLTTPLAISSGGTGITSAGQNHALLGPLNGTGPPTWRAITSADIPAQGTPVFSSLNVNGVAYALNPTTLATTTAGTQYQSLISNATGSPTFQALDLAQPVAVTGTLAVLNGGTGTTTATGTGSTVRSIAPTLTGTTVLNGGSSIALDAVTAISGDAVFVTNTNSSGFGSIRFRNNNGATNEMFIGVGGSTTTLPSTNQAYIKTLGPNGLLLLGALKLETTESMSITNTATTGTSSIKFSNGTNFATFGINGTAIVGQGSSAIIKSTQQLLIDTASVAMRSNTMSLSIINTATTNSPITSFQSLDNTSDMIKVVNNSSIGNASIKFLNSNDGTMTIGTGGIGATLFANQAFINVENTKGLAIKSYISLGDTTTNPVENPVVINYNKAVSSITAKSTNSLAYNSIQLRNNNDVMAEFGVGGSAVGTIQDRNVAFISAPLLQLNCPMIQPSSMHTVITNWQSTGQVYKHNRNGGLEVSEYVDYPIGTVGYYYFGPSGTTHNYGSLTVNPLANGNGLAPYWLMPVTGIYSVKWRWTPSPFYNKACILKNNYGNEFENSSRGSPDIIAFNWAYYYAGNLATTMPAGLEICGTYHATTTDRIYFSHYQGNNFQNTQQPKTNDDTSWQLTFTLIQRTG